MAAPKIESPSARPNRKKAQPKAKRASRRVRAKQSTSDLIPDTDSQAFKVVDHAARTGKRVSTRGMTSREFKEALLGNLPPR